MTQPEQPAKLSMRPKGGGPSYAPQRDLAYVYPHAMKEAFVALDKANWSDEMTALIKKLGITEEDIGKAAFTLAEASNMFLNVEDIASANDALVKAGWYDHPVAVRYLIYGRLGEVMLGGFFVAIRDISGMDEEAANKREVADLIAAGKVIMCHSIRTVVEEPAKVSQVLRLQAELDGSRTAHTAMKVSKYKAELQAKAANAHLLALYELGWWKRLWWAVFPTRPVTENSCGEEKEDKEGDA